QVSPLGRALPAYGRGIPAPGKVTFTGSSRTTEDDETEVRDAYVELHVDGSAFAASPVGLNTADDGSDRQVGELTLIDDGILVIDGVLRWSARQVGAWGTATLVMGLSDPDEEGAPGAIRLVSAEGGVVRPRRGTRGLTSPIAATTIVDLAHVATLQERLSV